MVNREYSPQNKLACSIGRDGKSKILEARTVLSLFLGVREPSFWSQFIYDFIQQIPDLEENVKLG